MKALMSFAVVTAALCSTAAYATDFSYTGNFTQDNDKAAFTFTVGTDSTVTLVTYSYAGGTNAAGEAIAEGGFDPILSLYDSSGNLVSYDDDGPSGTVPTDSVTGAAYDTYLQSFLAAGSYTVYVTQYNNFGPSTLPNPFPFDNDPNFRNGFVDATGHTRDGHWAFDILNVDQATGPSPAPEPASWAMMLGGFGMIGGAMRARRKLSVSFA